MDPRKISFSHVKKNGLKKNIIFSGVLNKYKIAKLMNKSDYFDQ